MPCSHCCQPTPPKSSRLMFQFSNPTCPSSLILHFLPATSQHFRRVLYIHSEVCSAATIVRRDSRALVYRARTNRSTKILFFIFTIQAPTISISVVATNPPLPSLTLPPPQHLLPLRADILDLSIGIAIHTFVISVGRSQRWDGPANHYDGDFLILNPYPTISESHTLNMAPRTNETTAQYRARLLALSDVDAEAQLSDGDYAARDEARKLACKAKTEAEA
ncbi:hypothetical protein B0H10DRAFT_2231743 [Mycena sp. CBHHK59/15]|nr:hypothetical protein B0H10DRAFT_2231743 [Mycena sp. CBHHK59/15]